MLENWHRKRVRIANCYACRQQFLKICTHQHQLQLCIKIIATQFSYRLYAIMHLQACRLWLHFHIFHTYSQLYIYHYVIYCKWQKLYQRKVLQFIVFYHKVGKVLWLRAITIFAYIYIGTQNGTYRKKFVICLEIHSKSFLPPFSMHISHFIKFIVQTLLSIDTCCYNNIQGN